MLILAAHARRDTPVTMAAKEVSLAMKTTAKRLTKAEVRGVVEGFAKALNDHDVDAAVEYLTDDVVWTHPFTMEPLHGPEAVRADLAETFRSFPDLHSPLEDTEVFVGESHDTAVTTWTMLGTMSGPSPVGFEATGRFMRITGASRYSFRDGRISEYELVYDGLEFARQLGILPSERSLTFKALQELQRWTAKARKTLRI